MRRRGVSTTAQTSMSSRFGFIVVSVGMRVTIATSLSRTMQPRSGRDDCGSNRRYFVVYVVIGFPCTNIWRAIPCAPRVRLILIQAVNCTITCTSSRVSEYPSSHRYWWHLHRCCSTARNGTINDKGTHYARRSNQRRVGRRLDSIG